MTLLEELQARGLVHQIAEHEETPLAKLLETPQTVYAGFDPTSDSLHVGHLIPLLALRRFQQAGHKVIALAGGATGMVGDPSGKSAERNLLTPEQLRANVESIEKQLAMLLDFESDSATLVNNYDWTQGISYLEFLRDIGKHFTINTMLRKDSVKGRLDRDGEGISYTEFSYMLLQGFDFFHLYEQHDCKIQVGGSDQWGNITAGTELIRRKLQGQAYGMTLPLLLKEDGTKFGKTAGGSVWLDPARTSPYAFRQFWWNTSDAMVIQLLKYFSFVPLDEIQALEEGMAGGDYKAPKLRLATAMTSLVHGEAESEKVEKAAEVLFSKNADFRQVPAEYLADAFAGAPIADVPRERFGGEGLSWLDVAVLALPDDHDKSKPISKSKARKLIEQNSLALNGEKVKDLERPVKAGDLLHETWLVLKKGKKNYFLVRAVD